MKKNVWGGWIDSEKMKNELASYEEVNKTFEDLKKKIFGFKSHEIIKIDHVSEFCLMKTGKFVEKLSRKLRIHRIFEFIPEEGDPMFLCNDVMEILDENQELITRLWLDPNTVSFSDQDLAILVDGEIKIKFLEEKEYRFLKKLINDYIEIM